VSADARLDILVVTGTFPSLSQAFITTKIRALAARGHRVTVISLAPRPGEGRALGAIPNVRIKYPARSHTPVARVFGAAAILLSALRDPAFAIPVFRSLRRSRRWRKCLKSLMAAGERPDLVHVEWITKAVELREIVSVFKCPVVVSCRGSDLRLMAESDKDFAAHVRRIFDEVDLVHCVSTDVSDVARRLGLPDHKVLINRPAVDTQFFSSPPRTASRDRHRLVTAGRVPWVKGLEYALLGVRLLLDRGIRVIYDVIGPADPTGMDAARLAVRDLSLADAVVFHGPLPPSEIRTRLSEADLYISPSLSEGISNAVLEAMAMALPVVSTNVGGMHELVRDGLDGRLIPSRDPIAIADAVEQLLANADQRTEMGATARRRVVESFDLQRQIDRFVDAYERLQAGRYATDAAKSMAGAAVR